MWRPDWGFDVEWTPCAGVGGVYAASVRRPDLGCKEEWTPCASEGGVQIREVERNGRHELMCVASRLWMWGGMDAM